jgi:type I restriction enzyme S subunit
MVEQCHSRSSGNLLPEGWVRASIGEICSKVTDGSHNPPKASTEGLPMLSAKNIHDGTIDFRLDHRLIPLEAFKAEDQRTCIAKNDILLTIVGALGRTAVVRANTPKFTLQRSVAVLASRQMHSKSMRYSLEEFNFQQQVLDNAKGTAQRGIYLKKLRELTLPIPPLAEQKVIADKLDTLLAQVEATKARLERIPEILKTFRQSVLADAVSGKLTEEWRAVNTSDFTKEERLEEIRKYKYETWIEEQEAKYEAKGKWPKTDSWKKKYKEAEIDPEFKSRELPESWVNQPLDGLVYISARIGWKGLKASEYTQSGPLFLSVHSLNYGQEVKLSEAFNISQERYDESPEIMLQNDDILLCKDGAGIGKIGIVKNLAEPASINSSLLLIRSGKYFVPKFLYFFLAGPTMQRLVQERMTGSAVPHLFQRDVKEFVLEIPPISEQREIVRRVEELLAFADGIEQKANAALQRVNNLTQSILAKAFRGELTAKWRAANPESICGENSAEALLEKIKAEREAFKPVKKSSVRKKS